MFAKLSVYWRLMRFDKPTGILLLFWPVAWAMILTQPSLFYIVLFSTGVVLMRAAGCVANDLADRNLDKWVARTKDRPLTSGEIPVSHALIVLAILLGLAASLLFFLNALCFKIALLAAAMTLIYPFCKRFMNAPQIMLGITFNLGVLMVFAQTQQAISSQALTLYTAAALWTIAYDTLYAMSDKEDDLKIGIKSTALWFGEYDYLITCVIYAGFLMNLVMVKLSFLWLLPFALVIRLLYRVYLNRESALSAFKDNVWVGLAVAVVFSVEIWT